jgi:serine/threonine-protein kinase RsbW
VPAEARFEEDARTADGLRAVAVAPLDTDGRPLGVLRYGFAGEHAFSPSERAFACAAAGQAGQALERAQLLAERELAAWRAGHLAELSRALYEVTGYAERVERLVALIRPPVADFGAVEPEDPQAPAFDPPAIETTLDGGSRVRVRLRALGRAFGVLTLTRRAPATPFERGDLPFLTDLAGRAALALENARLYEQQRDVARVLQRSLLAWDPPRDGRYEVAATYRPAVRSLEVGGDWHDCFPLGEDRVGIVVGDVVGRGIEAATAMGQLRSATRALAGAHDAPARVIEGLDTFVEQIEAARYATLAYAVVDLETGEMTYACAGHPPPALLEPGSGARLLWDGRSPPVGAALEDLPRPEARLPLADGARLVLFTDGLVERRFESLDGGLARLVAELERRGESALGALAEEITDALALESPGHDDVCLLAFRYRRGGGRRWTEDVSAGSASALAPA